MAPRLEEKYRAERRAWIRRALIWVGSLVAVAAIGWGIFFSPLFAFSSEEATIETGGDGIDPAAVRDVLAQYDGVPLTRVRVATIEESIKEIVVVLDADVTRQWPNALNVTVIGRQPVAVVPDGEGYQLYDAEGVQLHATAEAPEGVPVIQTDVDDSTPATIAAILTVLGEMPEELRADIETISASSAQTITFSLRNGVEVKWGDSTENDLKAAVLDTLREQVDARVYDVSAPRSPVTAE